MSEQHVEEQQDQEQGITKEQVGQAVTVAGSLLTSIGLEYVTHNLPVALVSAVAVYAAGKFTPEIMKILIPGSDPDATSAATNAIVDKLAPAPQDERPQDALSKLKRLARIKSAAQPARPKDEPLPGNDLQRPAASEAPDQFAIPAQFKLDSVIHNIEAANSNWRLYFGQNGAGQAITVSIDDMYHVLDVSSSGKGKSNRFRLAMMQLVDTCEVYYINPFAARVKSVKDSRRVEVWAPILDRLANGKPMRSKEEINQITAALVNLIQDRSDREESGDFSWQDQPVFVFVDELPETFARCPESVERLDRIGRTGRQFGVFLYVASQTAQVSEIGQSTAAQANYKTRIYGGGDSTSSKRLMKHTVSPETERALQTNGAGLTLMLADGMSGLEFVRAPLVTNEAMFRYFGLEFNLDDWLPARGAAPVRRDHALNLSAPTTASMPAAAPPQEQTQVMTLARLTQLFQEDKIDIETFQHGLDLLKITDADVSRPREQEPASLHVVPSAVDDLERAVDAYRAGATSMATLAAALGISAWQARQLMPQVKQTIGA